MQLAFMNQMISWGRLGFYDVLTRYRRTVLGPLWIVMSTGVSIACLGVLYGTLFKVNMKVFFPYITAGIILWTFISSTLTEGTTLFLTYRHVVVNMVIYKPAIAVRVLVRNILVLVHNFVVFVIVAWWMGVPVSANCLLVIPGLLLLFLNMYWMILLLGYASSRFRDISQVVTALIGVLFLITPVIWEKSMLGSRAYFADINPLTHLIDIVRAPMLCELPDEISWAVSAVLLVFGGGVTVWVHARFSNRLPFWL